MSSPLGKRAASITLHCSGIESFTPNKNEGQKLAEPLQGNDLINTCMEFNFERGHGQFQRYFAIQHPYLPVPSTCTYPNWKIDPFLEHINKVSMQAICLPENISCDEQTAGFSGRDSKKAQMKSK